MKRGFALILETHYRMQTIQKISPHPSLLKRGFIPPFGKGRLGGILQINVLIIMSLLISLLIFLTGCSYAKTGVKAGDVASADRHLKNITQLTTDGDNGEAYFSWDSRKLIFQSNREGYK